MTVTMIKELSVEEINNRLDLIITRALLITSDSRELDPLKIYSDENFKELVVKPILELCLEEVGSGVKNLFLSNNGALGRCTKLLARTDKAYTCTDCAPHISSSLCEECFRNSGHVKHNHIPAMEKYKLFCHCGDIEAYRFSPPCCKHEIPENSESLPGQSVIRISNIIKHLFKYLEILCGEDSTLNSYVEDRLLVKDNLEKLSVEYKPSGFLSLLKKNIDTTNSLLSCLLIFKPEDESIEHANSCLSFAKTPGKLVDQLADFESCGYLCVKYRDTSKNCQSFGIKIQRFIQDRHRGSRLYCRIIKVHRLFFMKLGRVLVRLINKTCLRKSVLCDVMSEIVFKETTLPEKFLFNRCLWKGIRYSITFRILLPTLFSKTGALNFSKFYLQNFDRLYSELLVKNDLKAYVFRLALQFVTSKKQFTFLIENGFLCKILNFISCHLKKLGFGRGQSISAVLKKIDSKDFAPIYEVVPHLCEMLYFPLKSIETSHQIKSELQKTAIQFVQFCFDFDDMEPLVLDDSYKEVEINPDDVCSLVLQLHNIFVPYVFLLLKFDDIANNVIREFLGVFRKHLEGLTANLSTQQAIEKLITLPDIEKKPFSIFNLSQRLLFDILTECVIKRKLSEEMRKMILEDQLLLVWISQAAITSLSLEMYFKAGRLTNPSNYLSTMISNYHLPVMVHHLFVQDFYAIQSLISNISPEHFLKYLLFNLCPSIREKMSVSQPLASILSLREFDDTLILQQVFILIYNALTEMRLVGDMDDPDSYFIERQLIHMLACECKTRSYLMNTLYMDRATFKTPHSYSNMTNFDEILFNIAYTFTDLQDQETHVINPKYLNPGCPFYYLNTISDTKYTFDTILGYNMDGVPKFLLPEVIRLRDEFIGTCDFIFSETFFTFIMECFLKWYRNPLLWMKDSPDLFLFILLCLCLILKVCKHHVICNSRRERMFDFFGTHQELDNRSLLDVIIDDVPNCENPLVASMIQQLANISHIGRRTASNILYI